VVHYAEGWAAHVSLGDLIEGWVVLMLHKVGLIGFCGVARLLDRGYRRTNACVIHDGLAVQRHVQVAADEDLVDLWLQVRR